ncbi:SOS response-associated peptidase [Jannaschia seohaensis]|uniref:Abasic site processing protein n=1 Tax=Jannaschia seohaensis TaxID=475081 RepID=A0A2Y9APE2_9RHOB|nr:SOS response-associated peptidase [Jannaschia seohaensis]PWJ19304.1 putative SOS response-associated peptidase YedK [Jannaschia seohaensis]SSA45966.1 Putative SOS response-associated peptidase YedK [Jannaschia seohaensis]
MCGRYALTLPQDAMVQMFDAIPANDLPEGPRWNICPTTQIPVVRAGAERRALVSMRWGFLPHWYKTPTDGPLLINARAETVAEKPAFRAACRERRCLVPATGFYEWVKTEDGTRLPWYFHAADGGLLVFAGIWQDWGPDRIATCAIVSCAAGPTMREIHHREPVTLAPEDWPLWLGEAEGKAAPLMRAAPEGRIARYRVSRAVNSNRAEGPELIDPLIDEDDA